MSPVTIGEPVTGGALRATHFFNGRLLTGEDLQREQDVHAARLARLGTAIGEGVVHGLTVSVGAGSSAAAPVVTVRSGLAVSRSGLALALQQDTDVSLAGAGPRPGAEPGGLFADCQPFQPSEYSTGAGVYLLSIGPHRAVEGLAPVSGLRNAEQECETAYNVEAVDFRRLRLALPLSELDDRRRLRSRAAYRVFAPGAVASLWRDPFGTGLTSYGHLDELRPTHLHDDEVPLALIGWEAGRGISFVDHWSVRRRLTRRPVDAAFGPHAGDRLLAEGDARLLQFQEQLADIRAAEGDPAQVAARAHFTHLPAAGLVPVGPGRPPGFHRVTFFTGIDTRDPVFIEGPELEHLLRASVAFPPIAIGDPELVWLYAVRANVVAGAGATSYLAFAHGQMPFLGDARYQLAYFDLANYAPTD